MLDARNTRLLYDSAHRIFVYGKSFHLLLLLQYRQRVKLSTRTAEWWCAHRAVYALVVLDKDQGFDGGPRNAGSGFGST